MMRRAGLGLIYLPFLAFAAPTMAQDDATDLLAAHPWTLSLTGGATMISGNDDQPYAAISLGHHWDDHYVRMSAIYVDDGASFGIVDVVPADTRAVELAAGTAFGAVALDAYFAFGRRRFDREAFARRDGRTLTVDRKGKNLGFGATLTLDQPIGEATFVSPSIGVDYQRFDIGNAVATTAGNVSNVVERQSGVTGTIAVSLQQFFGADLAHGAGIYAAAVSTSNSSAFRAGNSSQAVVQLFAFRDVPGQKASWGEIGANASFALSDSVRFNLFASRTLGFPGPEATSLSSGLSFSF